jgi:hypothetical protein
MVIRYGAPTETAFSWDSPTWGQEGHNVRVAANGSHVTDRHEGN